MDRDGDLVFAKDGLNYVLFVGHDRGTVRLVLPNSWPIESRGERSRVLRAAAAVNAGPSPAKLYVVGDNTWGGVVLFLCSTRCLARALPLALEGLEMGAREFIRIMTG